MWVYLKVSLVPTKYRLIPFKIIHQFLTVFLLFLLILLGSKSQNFCATSPYALDILEQNRSKSYYDQNPTSLIFQTDFRYISSLDFRLPKFDEVKILKIQINFWDRKSAIKCRVLAELSFPHASYLVQDVRMADIRLASLVYLPCLR